MNSALLSLIMLGLIAWFWVDSLRSREQLLRICRQTCASMNITLLDETVMLSRIRTGRNSTGTLQFRRWYEFEVCADGINRHPGQATLLGRKLENLTLDLPEGPVIADAETTNVHSLH